MTKCLDEGALRAYLDRELPEAADHLEVCAECRGRLERMRAALDEVNVLLDALAPEDIAAVQATAPRSRWVAGLAAAALAASLALVLILNRTPRAPAPPAKSVPFARAVTPATPRPELPPKPMLARVRHRKQPSLDGFVPLAGADPLQMGMVVRVMLPVSDPSLSTGVREVPADLVIGEDGRARAIRFVE